MMKMESSRLNNSSSSGRSMRAKKRKYHTAKHGCIKRVWESEFEMNLSWISNGGRCVGMNDSSEEVE